MRVTHSLIDRFRTLANFYHHIFNWNWLLLDALLNSRRALFCNFYFLFYSINPQWMCPTDNKQPSKWCVCVDALLSYRTHTHLPLAHNPIGFVTRTHNHINAHTQPSATVIKVLHMGMVARVFAQWLNKLHEQANARPPPSHLHISRN